MEEVETSFATDTQQAAGDSPSYRLISVSGFPHFFRGGSQLGENTKLRKRLDRVDMTFRLVVLIVCIACVAACVIGWMLPMGLVR